MSRQPTAISAPSLELWGGIECTVNRVQDEYFDQSVRCAHDERADDMERIAALGLRVVRCGFPWEVYERAGNWELFDRRMDACRRAGIQPIAGLVHHGSGPEHTDLLDTEFPEKLAAYAAEFAARYPDVERYTPVNEPCTTARFSCLYAHWYPHRRSVSDFARAMVNEIKATVLAMRAVRKVNPRAQLITTEDGGRTFATPELEDVRLHREARKWLGTDLLCGLVGRDHPLFDWLVENGVSEDEVLWFGENICPPDVIGLNYYVTSDRFLDHELHHYPAYFTGGDGNEPLVDVEAVRVHPDGIAGAKSILTEAWERYGIPVAITEAHLGDRVEERIRWLAWMWEEALAARRAGADVRAVTVWALLGSWNWCHLVTRDTGAYEPGVFDLCADVPRDAEGRPVGELKLCPTELADVVRQLATERRARHPALAQPGWWLHQNRLAYRVA